MMRMKKVMFSIVEKRLIRSMLILGLVQILILIAFIRMCKHGGPNNSTIQNMDSLNQIWSPGRKYHLEDFGKYYSYGGKLW